jgi:phenylalanine-4-hydroxylase
MLDAEWLVAVPGLYFMILLQNQKFPAVNVMTYSDRLQCVVVSGCLFAIQTAVCSCVRMFVCNTDCSV